MYAYIFSYMFSKSELYYTYKIMVNLESFVSIIFSHQP